MDTTGWIAWTLPDPQLGMPVLGLRHPPGWTAQGNVTWVAEHTQRIARAPLVPGHPPRADRDGAELAAVRLHLARRRPRPAQRTRAHLPAPDAPDRSLGAALPQLLGPGAQQPTRFEVRPLPDWAQRFHIPPESITPGVAYTGLHARVEAPVNGRRRCWNPRLPLRGQQPGRVRDDHQPRPLPGGAQRNRRAVRRVAADAVRRPGQRDPQPGLDCRGQRVGQQNTDAFAAQAASARWASFQAEQAGIAAVGAAAADLRATQASNAQAQFDRMMQPPPMAGTPGVSAQEAWRNALGGVEAVEDPNSREGNTKYVSSSTAVHLAEREGRGDRDRRRQPRPQHQLAHHLEGGPPLRAVVPDTEPLVGKTVR